MVFYRQAVQASQHNLLNFSHDLKKTQNRNLVCINIKSLKLKYLHKICLGWKYLVILNTDKSLHGELTVNQILVILSEWLLFNANFCNRFVYHPYFEYSFNLKWNRWFFLLRHKEIQLNISFKVLILFLFLRFSD